LAFAEVADISIEWKQKPLTLAEREVLGTNYSPALSENNGSIDYPELYNKTIGNAVYNLTKSAYDISHVESLSEVFDYAKTAWSSFVGTVGSFVDQTLYDKSFGLFGSNQLQENVNQFYRNTYNAWERGDTDYLSKQLSPLVENTVVGGILGGIKRVGPNNTQRLDDLKIQGHSLERHGGSITNEQLYTRARTGIAPDGSKTRRGYTPTSTAFNSDDLLVHADDFLRNNYLNSAIKNAEPGTLRIKVSGNTGVDLGRGYVPVGKKTGLSGPLQKVDGLTNAEAWYVYDPAKNIWQTNTIYPIPGK